MKKELKMIKYPDYKNSIVNLSSSILHSFSGTSPHPQLKQLNMEKLQSKKNILLFILDGFGLNLLTRYKKELPWLYDHLNSSITSVFPPTTSAAITSLISGRTPYEHGIIGWTLFFKEFAKYIDYLPIWDTITTSTLDAESYNIFDIMDVKTIFQQIHDENTLCYNITPLHISESANTLKNSGDAIIMGYKNNYDMFSYIRNALAADHNGRKFIYTYNPEPDHMKHTEGTNSINALTHLKEMDNQLEKLAQELRDTGQRDTAIIVTADHGLIDIDEYFYVNEDKELFDTLLLPTFPEPRFISFFSKPGKQSSCRQALDKYKNDFWILDREEFFSSGILGSGVPHKKIDDFIGDFIAIAHTNKAMKWILQQNGKSEKELIAHHAGLHPDEMIVPLIYFEG